jgi:Ring finger domain
MSSIRCTGCFPRFEENQLAHMEPGGCLWCDHEEINSQFNFDAFIQDEHMSSYDDEVSSSTQSKADTECCICYEMINKNKNNCVTECGHSFCLKCLVTSFAHGNNACPYCRMVVIDMPQEEDNVYEEDEISEYEEDIESDSASINIDEDYEHDDNECDIDELTRRLETNGFTMKDILSMLIGRYTKGTSNMTAMEMGDKFDRIVLDADSEAMEQKLFAAEDMRV